MSSPFFSGPLFFKDCSIGRLLEEGKKNLAGFFVDNLHLRIFKDPLPGRVKPTAQRLCSNRSHKDDCRKMPGLYSNNSSGTLRSKP